MGSCCKYTKQIIKGCDCFGTLITFRINDDLEYKSLMGGISTIFFFIIASLYISYMSYYFLTRQNVDFIFSKKTINEQPFLNLSQIGYRFAFGIQYTSDDSSAVLNTTKYFNYSIREIQIINSEIYIEKPVKIKLCNENDFRNQVNRTFQLRGLSKMYCPILDNVNYTIEGTMMDPYYKYYNLEIWLTNYALNNFQELEKYVESHPLEMSYYFLDNAIDYEDRKSPLPNFLNYLFKAIDINYEKDVEIIKSPMEFSNDENILFNRVSELYGATIDNHVDSFHSITEPNELGQSMIGKYILKASPIMFALSRSYQKLPSFVADVSGILEEVLELLLLCVNILERQAIDNKLIQKMLKFQGCKNYDVKYLLHLFKSDYNYNSRVMEIINKDKMLIKKNTIGGVYTTKSEMIGMRKKNKINTVKELETKKSNLSLLSHKKKKTLDLTRDDKIQFKEDKKEGIELLNINKIHDTSNNYSKKINTSRSFIESINAVNQQSFHNNLETNKIFYITPIKSETIIKKNNEENYADLGIFSVLWSKLFFWSSKKLERRREFFVKAEEKIHYFFDVYNYIQKMQEVDLLVYTLLDDDQVKLFEFLSRPPLQISPSKTNIYNEFESRQSLYMKIGKKPIDELYDAYNKIRLKNDIGFEDLKLLRLTNAEVKFLD
jgi:hypothetical protein